MDDQHATAKKSNSTRFRKGRSGNRRGRPRGAKHNKTILAQVANELLSINENGTRKRRTVAELVLLTLRNLAIEGHPCAVKAYAAIIDKYDAYREPKGGFLIAPIGTTLETTPLRIEEVDDEPVSTTFPPPPDPLLRGRG
ncbi:MAG: DUF5681 domain-containing protein [Pseudomonadota bacterium]